MDRRWRSQSQISINDRESGKISLNFDELLKTPPKSPFFIDNMSISISRKRVSFLLRLQMIRIYSISQPIIRGKSLKKKMKIYFLLYSLRFVLRLLVPVPVPGTVTCKHILWSTTYQVYCIRCISCSRYVLHLASCIFIVPRILDLDILSGIWDGNCGTLTILISDQAITVVGHTESIRFGNR